MLLYIVRIAATVEFAIMGSSLEMRSMNDSEGKACGYRYKYVKDRSR
jgi:hypothetical protein